MPAPTAPGSLQSFTATGLAGETHYHWAVRAVDEAGNVGPLSELAMAKTNPVAPAAIEDLAAEFVAPDGVKLSWTASGDDHKQSRAASYELRYATQSLGSQNFALATLVAGVPAPKAAGATDSFAFAGLEPGKVHRFALLTRDEEGNTSYLSNVAVLATPRRPDVAPPATISDLAVRQPSAAGLKLAAKVLGASSGQAPQFPANAVVDGSPDTAWASLPRTESQLEWVRLDLGEAAMVDRIQLWPSGNQPQLFPQAVEVATSPDGLAWTVVSSAQGIKAEAGRAQVLGFAPHSTRFVEVRATVLASHDNDLYYSVMAEVDVMTAHEPSGTLYAAFTAPLDDGVSERAARYELAASLCPFDVAAATALPTTTPLAAGTPERFRFTGLAAGNYCVAVRSADEANNLSPWSNIGRGEVQ